MGKLAASWALTWSCAAVTASASGWAKMVLNSAAAMCWWLRGTTASRFSDEMDPTALAGGTLEPAVGGRCD